jgi:hypothetical protein
MNKEQFDFANREFEDKKVNVIKTCLGDIAIEEMSKHNPRGRLSFDIKIKNERK